MTIDLEVCEECGAYYAQTNWNNYFMEYGHQTWHREQKQLVDELKALIKGEHNEVS